MLVGFYGGTFDPIHLGHLHAASSVRHRLALDEVRLVLAGRPSHRRLPSTSIEHRWAMLRLACDDYPGLVADDCELTDASSYTVATLEAVRDANPEILPCWILGQDAFATLPTWHRWEALMTLCNLIVVDRPDDRREEPAVLRRLCEQTQVKQLDSQRVGQMLRLDLPMKSISATQVRQMLAESQSVEHLLTTRVNTYITQHQLYNRQEGAV